MNLKTSIVIVSQFSVPLPGGKGSRGATPGSYVERYMARDDAVEPVAPIQVLRTDDYVLRYMAREDAVEQAGPSKAATQRTLAGTGGRGGVAFGYGSASLSDAELKAASADIQRHFDQGKTVLKTVLSFDEDYLKARGLVSADFHCEQRGDYRGHLDQMKLRMAIMRGLDRMSAGGSGFDDLRYVGVIQVDTEHVHAHLAMVDAGPGTLAGDGTQRGKLSDRHKSRLRRGLDGFLDDKQAVAHLSSAVGYERRNVTTFVKRWAHDQIRTEALPQFLLACLPEDRTLWRAGSHHPAMRKANRLVTELVTEHLARPGSPLPAALAQVQAYADHRRDHEGLTATDWQRLVDQGTSQIIERAVNGVYGVLRALPEHELRVRTPMLAIMSMDYERLAVQVSDRRRDPGHAVSRASGSSSAHDASADELEGFGFRLRSYGSRLRHHQEQSRTHHDRARHWERADRAGAASADSRPLYNWVRFEADYHRRLVSKYRHFLPFAVDTSPWWTQQRDVEAYGQRLLSLQALRGDAALQRMRDGAEAERLGREIYGQSGGRYLTQGAAGRQVLDTRIGTMTATYNDRLDVLRTDLAGAGLILQPGPVVPAALKGDEPGPSDHVGGEPGPSDQTGGELADPITPVGSPGPGPGPETRQGLGATTGSGAGLTIVPGAAYSFDEVKALDLHRLHYDFPRDITVGPHSVRTFQTAAAERRRLLLGALDYLDRSGQGEAISGLPVGEVAAMTRTAHALAATRDPRTGRAVLRSAIAALRAHQDREETPRSAAAPTLDSGLGLRLHRVVDQAALDGAARAEVDVLAIGYEPDRL